MSGRLFSAFLIGSALSAAALPAFAITCYEIIDRNDEVIFRDTKSPVDLSNAGAPAREAMRSRGELLVIFDVKTCRISPTGGRSAKAVSAARTVVRWRAAASLRRCRRTSDGHPRPRTQRPPDASCLLAPERLHELDSVMSRCRCRLPSRAHLIC